MSGVGTIPFGTGPYGLGLTLATPSSGKIFRDPVTNASLSSRRIDPKTRSYVLDENGRILGMTKAQQLVAIAFSTTKGSAAVRELGEELLSIDRMGPDFERRADILLRKAVVHIVQRKIIVVNDTGVVRLRPGVAYARMRWTDTETGIQRTQEVGR